jgi:hypothetical protein
VSAKIETFYRHKCVGGSNSHEVAEVIAQEKYLIPKQTVKQIGIIAVALAAAASTFAAGLASDSAADSAYSDGWDAGDNGGTGWGGGWSFYTSPPPDANKAGFVVQSSQANGFGDGNVDTGGRAWGAYANNSYNAVATRPLNGSMVMSSPLDHVELFNYNAGSGSDKDAYFNNLAIIPEPSSFALVGIGLFAVWIYGRRKI